MKKKAFLYRLTDAKGDQHFTVINEAGDNGMIGGVGDDGEYHQFDSSAMYHAYKWAEERGMKLECATVEIEVTDAMFAPKAA